MTSKTESVHDLVFQAILRGDYRPGDRIPAERDMAVQTSTSRVTVRRAYAALEKAGILQCRHGSGTYISRTTRGTAHPNGLMAVLASLRDPFALEFIAAMEGELAAKEGFLILKLTDQDPQMERIAAGELVSRGIRNLIVWASGGKYDADLFERLRILGTNMVFFDRILPGDFADYVGLDNSGAMDAITDDVVRRGKRRVIMVTHRDLGADSDTQRENAFFACCDKKRLDGEIHGVPWWGRRSDDLHKILPPAGDEEPPAIVCVNDELAIEVKQSRPELSVYGIDGLPEAVARGIVTYRQPMRRMAKQAVELLFAQQTMGDNWQAGRYYYKGELVGGGIVSGDRRGRKTGGRPGKK
ncbi:MAG: GntR family transcriptional regulator [Planctomycetes bacterium]|nr:GntR family transcriptional regulator [Planctomycetota bacterium]